jgi:hypothetical protein
MIWTKKFWKGASERAVKTFFQTFVAVVGVGGIGSTVGLGQVNWLTDGSISIVAAILSIATSIGNADFTSGPDLTK